MTEHFVADAPVIADVDVLVVGGGPAGFAAALAAAREGARTLLIEQYGSLGGVAAHTLIGVWLGSYSRDGAFPVIGGVFCELVTRMAGQQGAIPPAQTLQSGGRHIGYAEWHKRVVPIEFEACKLAMEQMALEAGVGLRYFSTFVAPKQVSGRVEGVFIHSKSGMEFIHTRVVVDASGDADVAFRAGCPVEVGREEDGLMSGASVVFVLEGVDSHAWETYCRETGDVRLRKVIADAKACGEWPFPFDIVVCCEMIHRGRFFINALQQTGVNGLRADDLTRGMLEGRREAHILTDLLRRNAPGFSDARLVQTSSVLGVRDTRRIVGDHRISTDDVSAGRRYPDTIALSGYQWDMADPKQPSQQSMEGKRIDLPFMEIPYRSLLPQGADNLIVAGRSLSCAWQALGVARIMPACMAMGQAAGAAAALAVAGDGVMRNVDVAALRAHLLEQGAILDPCAQAART
jgi:hypothetical protein